MAYIYPKNADGSARNITHCEACGLPIISRNAITHFGLLRDDGTETFNIGENCFRKVFFAENQIFTFKNGKTFRVNPDNL